MHDKVLEKAAAIAAKLHDDSVYAIKGASGASYGIRNLDNNVRCLDFDPYTMLTQNPYRDSEYGKRAREGAQIAWLIYQPTNKWLARIENGVVYKL